jgi:hypothetical protein
MLYPYNSYKDFQGWIPETDIDGVDAKKNFVADCRNIDFENGHIKNAVAPLQRAHPAEVLTLLNGGYTLYSTKHFTHSERGNTFIYVLYNTSINDLKLILEEIDNSSIIELNLDPQNSNITFIDEPTKINYNFVNDQLKINLNCIATYNALSKDVILNLTLVYLKSEHPTYWQDYVPEDTTPGTERLNGWYCFPRWLGWSFGEGENINVTGGDSSYYEDFEDTSYITGFDIGSSFVRTTGGVGAKAPHEGSYSALYNGGAGADSTIYMSIANVYALKKISFWCIAYLLGGQSRQVVIKSGSPHSDGKILGVAEIYTESQVVVSWRFIEIDLNYLAPENTPETIYITFEVPADPEDLSYINIDQLRISAEDGLLLLIKNLDGQRALVKEISLAVFAESVLSIPIKEIDWRVTAYELYSKQDSIYYKFSQLLIETDWTLNADNVEKAISYPAEDIEAGNEEGINTTLNFNYGLGASVRVDNQKTIFSEVSYKGRIYFNREDKRNYQSHLSGTGRIQPDSFPFNEDLQFGYFEEGRSARNIALLITPLEELLTLTERKNSIYYIQGAEGVVYRTSKAINGNASIYSYSSAIRELNGEPIAEVVAWFNENSIWIHTGGRNAPVDIVKNTHRNYWKNADKENATIFFNSIRNEIWICLQNKDIIIYELSYGGFKKYQYPYTVKEYVGTFENKVYFLCGDEKVRYLDYSTTNRLSGMIETHYDVNTVVFGQYPVDAPEHETKILQELYISTKDIAESSQLIDCIIIADGNEYEEIKFNLAKFTELLPAPLLIRYGKVKLRLNIPATRATIREFGYSFTNEGQNPAMDIPSDLEGLGLNIGLKIGVQ